MATAVFALVLLAILIVIAVLVFSHRSASAGAESAEPPLIQRSGIYSIVRESPRTTLSRSGPSEEDVRKYLASINEDIHNYKLSENDRKELLESWLQRREENIRVIEQGDEQGAVAYYYLELEKENECGVCSSYFKSGHFVTREEIYRNPTVIPPFHLGCTTRLVPYRGKEDSRETVLMSMTPLFGNREQPVAMPDWKTVIKPGTPATTPRKLP